MFSFDFILLALAGLILTGSFLCQASCKRQARSRLRSEQDLALMQAIRLLANHERERRR